jgi:hypothetical protein
MYRFCRNESRRSTFLEGSRPYEFLHCIDRNILRFTRKTMMPAATAIASAVDLSSVKGQYTLPAYTMTPQMMPPNDAGTNLEMVMFSSVFGFSLKDGNWPVMQIVRHNEYAGESFYASPTQAIEISVHIEGHSLAFSGQDPIRSACRLPCLLPRTKPRSRQAFHATPLRIANNIEPTSNAVVAAVTSHRDRFKPNIGSPISRIAPKKRTR